MKLNNTTKYLLSMVITAATLALLGLLGWGLIKLEHVWHAAPFVALFLIVSGVVFCTFFVDWEFED